MKLNPLGDRVVLTLEKAQEVTSGGIALPQNAQEQTQFAKVVAVGPGRTLDTGAILKPEVSVGDKVVISGRWAGENVMVEGIEYKVISSSDVLAVIQD
jgi:chaperonin GroES